MGCHTYYPKEKTNPKVAMVCHVAVEDFLHPCNEAVITIATYVYMKLSSL